MIKNVLSIAGSDPSGGAGLQADMKTFAALGCYGMAVPVALTAQNTRGVSGVHYVPADFVAQQIDAIFEDIEVHAVKLGMLGNAEIIGAVAAALKEHKPQHIVIDPVMVASSGDLLLQHDAIQALKDLIPQASVLTPNIPEAEVLTDMKYAADVEVLVEALRALGAPAVVLKGGHGKGEYSTDVLITQDNLQEFSAPRIETNHTHGTGCTLSSALACMLACGHDLPDAARRAKEYVTGAIEAAEALDVGSGHGPLHHAYKGGAHE